MANHPLNYLTKLQNGYSFGAGGNKARKTEEEMVEIFSQYLQELSEQPNCRSVHKNTTSCTCLAFLRGKRYVQEAISRAILLAYLPLDYKAKQMYAVEKLRVDESAGQVRAHLLNIGIRSDHLPTCNFMFPLLPVEDPFQLVGEDDDDAAEEAMQAAGLHKICVWAWCRLLNIGRRKYMNLKRQMPGGTLRGHGNEGNENRCDRECRDSLKARFQGYQDTMATPVATRFVRDESGHLSTRTDDDSVFLPPSFRMRADYVEWCLERGWLVRKKCRGKQHFYSTTEWTSSQGVTEQEQCPEVSWTTYRAILKRFFPKVKVCSASQSTQKI